MTEGKRLFCGLRISVATANALASAVETLARRAGSSGGQVRWVPPALYHVTIGFFGWTPVESVSALRDALGACASQVDPFSFSTARLGAFPDPKKARVLWAGVTSPSEALEALAARVGHATAALGFAAPTRPFHAHVTLGRLREPKDVSEVLLPLMEQMFSDTKATGLTLFESVSKSGTLTYREVAHFGFSAPEIGRKRQSVPLELDTQNAPSPASKLEQEMHETDDGWPRGHLS